MIYFIEFLRIGLLRSVRQTSAFNLSIKTTVRGNTLTVDYNTTEEAMCTCQLDSDSPTSCKILYTILQVHNYG